MVNKRRSAKTGKEYNDGNKDPSAPHNRFYSAHGSDVQKRRVIRRMEAGKKIKKATLEKYGIEVPETKQCVKAIRGRRVVYPADMYYVRMGDPPPVPVPAPAPSGEDDDEPAPVITIDESGDTGGEAHVQDLLEGGDATRATAQLSIQPEPLPTGSIITYDYLNNYLRNAIRGGAKECSTIPRQKPDGSLVKDTQGQVCYLKNQTLKSLQRNLTTLVDVIGCSNTEDIVACFRQFRMNMEKLQKEFTDPCKLTRMIGVVLSLRKYIPEFRRQIGAEIIEKYGEKMEGALDACRIKDEGRTSDPSLAVPAFPRIQAVIPKVKAKWGEDSMEYLASYLQVKLEGLRMDLGLIRVVESEAEAKNGGHSNYYVRSKDLKQQRIVISKFKTSKDYKPYNFILPESVAKTIENTFGKEQTHPPLKDRKWLISRLDGKAYAQGSYGGLITKAFKQTDHDLGNVTVYDIRHSMETNMLKTETSNNIGVLDIQTLKNKIADKFKHTPAMALGYPRAERAPVSKTATQTTSGSTGATIQKPTAEREVVSIPRDYSKYTTKENDTLGEVAKNLGVEPKTFKEENLKFHPEFPKTLNYKSKFQAGVVLYFKKPSETQEVSQTTKKKPAKKKK